MRHSLEILELLYDHDDFMESVRTVADMGAGDGDDALWWATRSTREDEPRPLNIKVKAVDLPVDDPDRRRHKNIDWVMSDFSNTDIPHNSIDLVWAHDSLQFTNNPIGTLSHWHSIMKTDAMLCLTIPYNHSFTNYRHENRIDTVTHSGAYFNYTISNLIVMLASCGFDCRGGHFKFSHEYPWIDAAVYKGEATPQAKMNWYELLDNKLLPVTAETAILARGYLRDSDLTLEWIDHSVYSLKMQ